MKSITCAFFYFCFFGPHGWLFDYGSYEKGQKSATMLYIGIIICWGGKKWRMTHSATISTTVCTMR